MATAAPGAAAAVPDAPTAARQRRLHPQTSQTNIDDDDDANSQNEFVRVPAPRGLLRRLFAREMAHAAPSRQPLVARAFYTNVFPNRSAHSLDIPPGVLPRRFSPDGRLLVCFSENLHAVRVYAFAIPHRSTLVPPTESQMQTPAPSHPLPSTLGQMQVVNETVAAAGPSNSNAHASQISLGSYTSGLATATTTATMGTATCPPLTSSASSKHQHQKPPTYRKQPMPDLAASALSFTDILKLKYEVSLTSGHEMLCKDFCLFTANKRHMILASAVTASSTTTTPSSSSAGNTGFRRFPSSLDCIPRLDNITFWVIDTLTGDIADKKTYTNDYMYLTNHSGVHLHDNMLGITSVQNQCVYMLVVKGSGKLVEVGTVGYFTREDDELVVTAQKGAERRFRQKMFDAASRGSGWLASFLQSAGGKDETRLGIDGDVQEGVDGEDADENDEMDDVDDGLDPNVQHRAKKRRRIPPHHGDRRQSIDLDTDDDVDDDHHDGDHDTNDNGLMVDSEVNQSRSSDVVQKSLQYRSTSQLFPPSYVWACQFGASLQDIGAFGGVGGAGGNNRDGLKDKSGDNGRGTLALGSSSSSRSNSGSNNSSGSGAVASSSAITSPDEGRPMRTHPWRIRIPVLPTNMRRTLALFQRELGEATPHQVPNTRRQTGSAIRNAAIARHINGIGSRSFNLSYIISRNLETAIAGGGGGFNSNDLNASASNGGGGDDPMDDSLSPDVVPEESMAPLGGLKHRILAYLYRRALTSGDPNAMQYFCTISPYISSLVMWRMQFLDRNHILIKLGPLECVTGNGPEPVSGHLAFFVVYAMHTTRVLGVFDISSEELFEMFAMWDCFHRSGSVPIGVDVSGQECQPTGVHMGSWVSNSLYARDGMIRHMVAVCQARNGGLAQAIRRTLSVLPTNAQSQSDSPYFDHALFAYDDKVVNAIDRVQVAPEFPIRFYCRVTGRHKFSIDTRGVPFAVPSTPVTPPRRRMQQGQGRQGQQQQGQPQTPAQPRTPVRPHPQQQQQQQQQPTRPPAHEVKRYVLNMFHPTDPVVFTVEQVHGHIQAFNFHYADF